LDAVTAQWVQLGGGETLVASRKGAWLQSPQAAALELWGSMPPSHAGTIETTRHLLDGAIAAAQRGEAPAQDWPPTARRWALALVDQWYTAHHSVALLPVALERYRSMHRPELVRFARRKLQEETGHDRLPLADLQALGYDAEATVQRVPPGRVARDLVRLARACVEGPRPVGFFGYIYALERRVIQIDSEALRALDGALPTGVQAASGVRAHAAEFDRQHVEELVDFIAGLAAGDRTEIALSCHRTAAICCSPPPADHTQDIEREHRLARHQPRARS
jgi:hypothetical protein